jgi:hypothetical protein
MALRRRRRRVATRNDGTGRRPFAGEEATMGRKSRMKLSELLLKVAERVNPQKRPRPHPFPVRADPHFRHPFQLPEARNVLFMGSGEQFGRWATALTREVFLKTLMFQDTEAWRWQRRQIRDQLISFFASPAYRDRPALLWTGQYCITYWYGVEELGRPAWEEFTQGWLFSRQASIPLGYQDTPAEVPKDRVAAISLDSGRLLFAHPEEKEGRILLACYYRDRPTPRGPRMGSRRESISLVVPGSGIDDKWVKAGFGAAYQGLMQCDGHGRPIFANACYLMAMRLLPTVGGNAWAEDFLMVFDSRDARIIEFSTRMTDFNAYTQNNDEHFARIVADYAHNKMTT